MKKILLSCLILGLFLSFGFHGFPGPICPRSYAEEDQIPPPFGKAKEMALKTSPDDLGRHLLFVEEKQSNDGVKRVFLIGYLSRSGYIGIGTIEGNRIMAVEYNEGTKTFFAYDTGQRVAIGKDKAIEFAFMIFRELVARNLI